ALLAAVDGEALAVERRALGRRHAAERQQARHHHRHPRRRLHRSPPPARQTRASSTRLNGVCVARRILPNPPPATLTSRRRATPASLARLRALSIEPTCESNPMKVDLGNALAMMIVDAPRPQPTSATLAPRSSFSFTPSSAGIHALTRLPM